MKLIIEIKQQVAAGVEVAMASPPEKSITQGELDAYRKIKAAVSQAVTDMAGGAKKSGLKTLAELNAEKGVKVSKFLRSQRN